MKTAAELYASFGRAGFLRPARWTAQPGGSTVAGDVRYRKPSAEPLGDGGVIVSDPSAQFPATQFVGIKRRDRLEIDTADDGTQAFRVRELHALADGAELQATLENWA